jgi:putative DNA primase/helicase
MANYKESKEFINSDSGNAERLITKYGDRIRYCEQLARHGWLAHDGCKWVEDETEAWKCAELVARDLLADAANEPDRDLQSILLQQGQRMLSESGARKALVKASKDKRIRMKAEDFDTDGFLLNFPNGTYDLRTHTLREHEPEDYITKVAGVDCPTEAMSPSEFDGFMEWAHPNEEVRVYILKVLSLGLAGDNAKQKLYVNHGSGDNGKNTLFDTIVAILGDYAAIIDIETIMGKHKNGPNPELYHLRGIRFAVGSETEANSKFRRLTGDGWITTRDLYKSKVTFPRTWKLHIHVNHVPALKDTGKAMRDRLRFIPWLQSVAEEDKDTELGNRLVAEGTAIMYRLLEAYKEVQDSNRLIDSPKMVTEATEDYFAGQDTIGQFLDAHAVFEFNATVSSGELFEQYTYWCFKNSIPDTDRLPSNQFAQVLQEDHSLTKKRVRVDGTQVNTWFGVRLVREGERDMEKIIADLDNL